MLVDVSVGDLLDKVSILEIKLEKITNPEKQLEIKRELAALHEAKVYIEKYSIWYSVLVKLNKHMWQLTDTLKSRVLLDEAYAKNAHQIMDFNHRRFRIKNILNTLETTSLKEQKSYPETSIVIDGTNLSHVLYAATLYDKIFLCTSNDICGNHSPFYPATSSDTATQVEIPEEEASIYELAPIRYISGGMVGDFIHQLSVVYETYLKTGRKGIVYIADMGGPFRRGLANTYADLKPVIAKQEFIEEFLVYNGEPVDVNLSQWRNHPALYSSSWCQIFTDTYGVPWGVNPWIRMPKTQQYENVTFISVTENRPCQDLDFNYIISKLPGRVIFLSTEPGQESYFLKRFAIPSIPVLQTNTFEELALALAGCHLFVGSLSMPLALADALGVNRIAIMPTSEDRFIASKTPKPYIFAMEDAYKILGK